MCPKAVNRTVTRVCVIFTLLTLICVTLFDLHYNRPNESATTTLSLGLFSRPFYSGSPAMPFVCSESQRRERSESGNANEWLCDVRQGH